MEILAITYSKRGLVLKLQVRCWTSVGGSSTKPFKVNQKMIFHWLRHISRAFYKQGRNLLFPVWVSWNNKRWCCYVYTGLYLVPVGQRPKFMLEWECTATCICMTYVPQLLLKSNDENWWRLLKGGSVVVKQQVQLKPWLSVLIKPTNCRKWWKKETKKQAKVLSKVQPNVNLLTFVSAKHAPTPNDLSCAM